MNSENKFHSNLSIFCLNIRSLRKHFDELNFYLNSLTEKFKIIILTEVWIKTGEEENYGLSGYNMLFQPRQENQAGGVVIYMDFELQFTHKEILLPTAEILHVCLDVVCNGLKYNLAILGIYRQCKFTFNKFKTDFENILKLSKDPTIIIGDVNICILKQKGSSLDYLNLINSYGFESCINTPTRIFKNSVSCIDHVLIRNSKSIKFEHNVKALGITDHYALNVFVNNVESNTDKRPKFCRFLNHDLLKRKFKSADWSLVLDALDVHSKVSNFYGIVNNCYNASYTLKKLNSKNRRRNEWASDNLISLVNRKNALFKTYSKNRNSENIKAEYKNLANLVTKKIKSAKLNFYSSELDSCGGDSRKYWNVLKKVLKYKKKNISKVRVDNVVVNVEGNECLIANVFNNYFSNIVSELKHKEFGEDIFLLDDNTYPVHLTSFSTNISEVTNTINSMKNKTSCGIDGLNILTIKENVDSFAPVLCNIFKASLMHGIVPEIFKTALVIPVFKTGDETEVSSYRPISLINSVAKVFEAIIKNKLLSYFEERSLFSINQYGFLPGRGTDLAINNHISQITSEHDKQKYTLALYLDLQKAFDVLDIDILIYKFRKYGIGGPALSWLMSFSKNRKQLVKINGQRSDTRVLSYGTAQGGILGPLNFLIYINDMLKLQLHSSLYAYADDTALVCSAYNRDTLCSRITSDLHKISTWLIDNKLLVNSSKSKCVMFFDCDKPKSDLCDRFKLMCHKHHCIYDCQCSSIEIVESVKYLGLIVDQHLKWNHHIQYIVKKLRKINYSLYYMRNFVKKEHLLRLYSSWFESTLRFGLIHYGGTYTTILNPIVMCQRHSLRIIFKIKRMDRVSHLFAEQGLLTVRELHVYCLLMYVHKYLFNYQIKEVERQTRSTQWISLCVPNFSKETSRHQLCYLAPKIYNQLIQYHGNDILFEKKPKFKMKALQYLSLMDE